jgi:hypothetical protein
MIMKSFNMHLLNNNNEKPYTIFFISTSVYSQEIKAGLVMPTADFKLCCIYIPNLDLKFMSKPNVGTGRNLFGKPDDTTSSTPAIIKTKLRAARVRKFLKW